MISSIVLTALAALQLASTGLSCALHMPRGSYPMVVNHTRTWTTEDRNTTLIKDVSVFNGQKFEEEQSVCISNGHIAPGTACRRAQTVVVEGNGKYLIPGLIDSHNHISSVQGVENFTSYGCTTALLMNCGNYTACKLISNQPGLATVLHAGMSAIGNGSMHERQDSRRNKATIIYPDTNATQFVEYQYGNGSNFHKITAEVSGPSVQQQIEMIRTAHEQYDMQTATHASDVMSYGQAIETRTDHIQHVPMDGLISETMVAQIVRQGQSTTPTLSVFQYGLGQPALHSYFGIVPGGNDSLAHAYENAKMLYRGGAPILAGTDAVGAIQVNGTVLNMAFGWTLHNELQNLVNIVGVTPAEALNMASRDAARWHRLPDRGEIRLGKRADLVLLNSNPLENISNTLDIDRIWVEGYKVPRYTPEMIESVTPP